MREYYNSNSQRTGEESHFLHMIRCIDRLVKKRRVSVDLAYNTIVRYESNYRVYYRTNEKFEEEFREYWQWYLQILCSATIYGYVCNLCLNDLGTHVLTFINTTNRCKELIINEVNTTQTNPDELTGFLESGINFVWMLPFEEVRWPGIYEYESPWLDINW